MGHLFYGMVTVDLLCSLRYKWIHAGEVVPGMKNKMYFESGHRMSKEGGFTLRLSSLEDLVGGTVRARVST